MILLLQTVDSTVGDAQPGQGSEGVTRQLAADRLDDAELEVSPLLAF